MGIARGVGERWRGERRACSLRRGWFWCVFEGDEVDAGEGWSTNKEGRLRGRPLFVSVSDSIGGEGCRSVLCLRGPGCGLVGGGKCAW